jgi:hypothetical protein
MKLVLLAGCFFVAAATAATPRPQADLRCEAHGTGPLLDCTVRLRDGASGAPLQGAQLTLGATMPSMPMAHSVKPMPAAPTGTPGEYRATLELEMLGIWAVQIDIATPVRDRIVRPLRVEDCPDGRRCPVPPARSR